jgi:hypothetical protein
MQTVNLVADVDARLISTGARFPRCYEVGRPVAAGLRRKVPRPRSTRLSTQRRFRIYRSSPRSLNMKTVKRIAFSFARRRWTVAASDLFVRVWKLFW